MLINSEKAFSNVYWICLNKLMILKQLFLKGSTNIDYWMKKYKRFFKFKLAPFFTKNSVSDRIFYTNSLLMVFKLLWLIYFQSSIKLKPPGENYTKIFCVMGMFFNCLYFLIYRLPKFFNQLCSQLQRMKLKL